MAVRFVTIQYDVDDSSLRDSEALIRRIAQSLGVTEDAVRSVAEEFEEAADAAGDVADETSRAESESKGMMSTVKKLGKIIAGAFAVSKISSFVKNAVGLAATMEQNRIAFTQFTGSAQNANKVLGDIEAFAASTPFQFPDLVETSKNLLAFGIEQEQILPILKQLGDVAAGTGIPVEELGAIFGKITTKGKAQTEELLQLAERGVPIIQVLAEQFGKTGDEIFEMASKGQISSDVIGEAFQNMTSEGGLFFDLTRKQSESTAGRLSTLQDNVERLARGFGEALLPGVNAITGALLDLIAPTSKESDLLREQQAEINVLTGILLDNESALETREEVLKQLALIQPELVEGIDAQNVAEEVLRERLAKTNEEFSKRIALALAQEKVNQILEQQADLLKLAVQSEIAINKAFADRFGTQNQLNTSLQEQIKALKDLGAGGLELELAFQTIEQREKGLANAANELAAAQKGLTLAQLEAGVSAEEASKKTGEQTGQEQKRVKTLQQLKKELSELQNKFDGSKAQAQAIRALKLRIKGMEDLVSVTGKAKKEIKQFKVDVDEIIGGFEDQPSPIEQIFKPKSGQVQDSDLVPSFEEIRPSLEQFFTDIGDFATDSDVNLFEEILGSPQEFLSNALGVASQITGIIGELQEAATQRRINDLEEQERRALELAGENLERRTQVEQQFQERRERLEKEAAKKRKRIAIAEAIIQTALNVIKVSANPIQAALVAAQGLAQIAIIQAQEFKAGGYTGDVGTDQVAGTVHGREFVLDARTTRELGLKGKDMAYFRREVMPGIKPGIMEKAFQAMNPAGGPNLDALAEKIGRRMAKEIGRMPIHVTKMDAGGYAEFTASVSTYRFYLNSQKYA